MIVKLVSHSSPRHLDDFLTLALLKARFPEAGVEYVHPQAVPESYLKDPQVAVIDCGGQYNAMLNNYDHHQDPGLPCSLVLVANIKHFCFRVDTQAPYIQAIDIIDRFGFQEAVKRGLAQPDKTTDTIRRTLLATELTIPVAEIVSWILSSPQWFDYNSFLKVVDKYLSRLEEYERAKEQLEAEEREFQSSLAQANVLEINGVRVVLSSTSLAPRHGDAFKILQADMIIETNKLNSNHTSLILNTASLLKAEAEALRETIAQGLPVVFRHATGFILVLDVVFDEVLQRVKKLA